jgi:protocatechuate 3,4-dioxygenase beta subunit
MSATLRPIAISLLFVLALLATETRALIMTGKGNAPVRDAGWPQGALEVANLKTRVGWWEGPPFGGGQWQFLYRGDAAALNEALKAFAAIRAPKLEVVINDGPQTNQFLRDEKDPKANTRVDWAFTVWVPENWHRLFNDPRSTFAADRPQFRQPVDPPTLEIYVTEQIDWSKVKMPDGLSVTDRRAAAQGKALPAQGAMMMGDVFDMASGKPVAGAKFAVERRTQRGTYEEAAAGTSDRDGRVIMENIPAGAYRTVVSAPGYAVRQVGYEEIRDRQLVKKVVHLSTATKLSGTVVDGEGKPVKDVQVRADSTMGIDGRGYNAPEHLTTKTDEKGQFTFDALPAGYTQFHASSPTLVRAGEHFKVFPVSRGMRSMPAEPVVIKMVMSGGIKGTVVNLPNGKAEGANIHVEPVGGSKVGSWGGSSNLKADGSFEFKHVPPGEYVLSTKPQHPGMPKDPNAKTVTVEGGKTVEVEIKYK